MPGARRSGFIPVQRQRDRIRHPRKGAGEVEIGRRRINRVRPGDQQGVDLAGAHVLGQFGDGRTRRRRVRDDRLDGPDDPAEIAQRGVDRVTDPVQFGRLFRAEHDEASSAAGRQIMRRRLQPFGMRRVDSGPSGRTDAERGGENAHGPPDIVRRQREPVVGLGAEQRRSAFDRIDPAHRPAVLGRASAGGKIPGVGEVAGAARYQVAFDRKDRIGGAQIVDEADGTAEGGSTCLQFLIAVERLPAVPAQPGKLLA